MLNGFVRDQVRRLVGPILGQNCMQSLSAEDSEDMQRTHTCKQLKAEVQGCCFMA